MTARDKATLKSYFETNDTPSESQFADQIDTFYGDWTDYSTGSVVNGWQSFTSKIIYYREDSNCTHVIYYIEGIATGTVANFTLPSASSSTINISAFSRCLDG